MTFLDLSHACHLEINSSKSWMMSLEQKIRCLSKLNQLTIIHCRSVCAQIKSRQFHVCMLQREMLVSQLRPREDGDDRAPTMVEIYYGFICFAINLGLGDPHFHFRISLGVFEYRWLLLMKHWLEILFLSRLQRVEEFACTCYLIYLIWEYNVMLWCCMMVFGPLYDCPVQWTLQQQPCLRWWPREITNHGGGNPGGLPVWQKSRAPDNEWQTGLFQAVVLTIKYCSR